MSETVIAATQMACGDKLEDNLARAEKLVREAAGQGAQIVLVQELFAGPYFCKDQLPEYFDLAETLDESRVVARMADVARELEVVLPVSFFERSGRAFFNSLAMIDADGELLGLYRKSHIPQGPGYEEKYYFSPGDTGFMVFETRYGAVGAGICWDQWFPECARAMALQGADVLLYPTAIGSEPKAPGYDSSAHWRRVMQGHAGANMVPLAAANRVGTERGESFEMTFYGTSFIADPTGAVVAELDRTEEGVIIAGFDFEEIARQRAAWGLFRDRRPDLYDELSTLDGAW